MSNSIVPPRNRAYLLLPDPEETNGFLPSIEITNDIMNWEEFNIRQVRDGLSGVYIEVNQSLELCRNARDIVRDLFTTKMLSARAMLTVERRGKKDFVYKEIYRAALDFTTYEEDKDTVKIEGKSMDFRSLLKSFGKTNYDIPVADLQTETWRYNHNQMIAQAEWVISEGQWAWTDTNISPPSNDIDNNTSYAMTAVLKAAEMILGGAEHDIKDEEFKLVAYNANEINTTNYFFMAASDQGIEIDIEFDYLLVLFNPNNPTPAGSAICQLEWIHYIPIDPASLPNTSTDGYFTILDKVTLTYPTVNSDTLYYKGHLPLKKGDKLRIVVSKNVSFTGSPPWYYTVGISNAKSFEIVYTDKNRNIEYIPTITRDILGQALLNKMTADRAMSKYTLQIQSFTASDGLNAIKRLVAGESIRGYENANFHTSFNDFIEYMQFMGFEYDVDETQKIIYFRKRGYYCNPQITALEMSENEVSDLRIVADAEHSFSAVAIGYEKPDIENVNGKYAGFGTFEYTTDYINTSASDIGEKLEIICPYKADPIEMELLTWERGKKTTDTKTDNDIFLLDGALTTVNGVQYVVEQRAPGSRYITPYISRGTTILSLFWWNGFYAPYFMAKRNLSRMCIGASSLKFASTDAFRNGEMEGSTELFGNLTGTGLFKPARLEFKAGTHQELPPESLRGGLVKVPYNGKTASIFINEIDKNASSDRSADWNGWIYSIE